MVACVNNLCLELSDLYAESDKISQNYMACLSKDVCGNEYVDPSKCAALSYDPKAYVYKLIMIALLSLTLNYLEATHA